MGSIWIPVAIFGASWRYARGCRGGKEGPGPSGLGKESRPGILKTRIWNLEFWDLAEFGRNLALLSSTPCSPASGQGAADSVAPRIPPGQGQGIAKQS